MTMHFHNVVTPKRICVKCKKQKLIQGGTTKMGKGFVCKDCREKNNDPR
jgi:hypothetical protein